MSDALAHFPVAQEPDFAAPDPFAGLDMDDELQRVRRDWIKHRKWTDHRIDDDIKEEETDIDIKEEPIVEEAKKPSRKADRPPKDEQDEIKLAKLFVHRWNHDTEPRFRSKTPDVRDVWFWHDKPANGHDAGWTGGHHAQVLAMRTMADVFEEAKAPARLRSANRLTGALKIATAQPDILTVHNRWDADGFTLGLPKAYKIDIRTGKLQHQHRDNLISQRTAVAPDADCPTPYLDRVQDHLSSGDPELRQFYMTILGLSLIGDNGHGRAFFWVGGGGSGKSTLLSVAKTCMGDYGTALNRQTLEGSYAQHMTFVASLIGARMAVVAELEGEDLNVGRFKALTGQDSMQVNKMRCDPVDFTSCATMHAAANPDHLPKIKVIDDAIRRRILIVPAGETLPTEEQDPEVKRAMLGEEQPGILARMMKEAVRFYNEGRLEIPQAVKRATDNYFRDADPVGRWIEERTTPIEGRTKATLLYGDFSDWWKQTGQRGGVLTMTTWGRSMTKLGHAKHVSDGVWRQGLRIVSDR